MRRRRARRAIRISIEVSRVAVTSSMRNCTEKMFFPLFTRTAARFMRGITPKGLSTARAARSEGLSLRERMQPAF